MGLDETLFGENSQSGESAKSTKDSIMALFGNSAGGNQQMFGVPGKEASLRTRRHRHHPHIRRTFRPNSHKMRDATRKVMQANGTC